MLNDEIAGAGILDCVTRRHCVNRKRIKVCNANLFFVGQRVTIWRKPFNDKRDRTAKPRGVATVFKIRGKSWLEFDKLPRGTRAGDILVVESAI